MKQKIVFKISEFPHISETFIVNQIVTAIKLGYEVEILIRKLLNNATDLNIGLIKKYALLDKIIIENYNIPKNKVVRFIKWIFLLISNFKDIDYIRKYHNEHSKFSLTCLYQWQFYKQFNDAAIIHIQYGTNKYPIDLLKKTGYFKPTVVVTFHGHDAFFPINGFIPNNGYYDNLFKNVMLITANTPYLCNKIEELGCPKNKLIVIPVGVDVNFFYPLSINKKEGHIFKIITVGRLDKVKGHSYSIEVVKKLIDIGFEVEFSIIGEGNERNNLEDLIKSYQLEDKVFLKGSMSQKEIRQELWEHDIYILTAVALKDGRRETQGLATIEAQACGLPVVVFDSGGVKYTLKDGISGFICDEFDVNAMVNKIKLFIEDPNLIDSMGKNAVKFVNESYSQKIIDKKWERIYKSLT